LSEEPQRPRSSRRRRGRGRGRSAAASRPAETQNELETPQAPPEAAAADSDALTSPDSQASASPDSAAPVSGDSQASASPDSHVAGSSEAAEDKPGPEEMQPAAKPEPLPDKPAEQRPMPVAAAVTAPLSTPAAEPETLEPESERDPDTRDDREAAEGGPGLYERLWRTGLPTVGAIAWRELSALFVSPIGYVVAAVLVLPVSFLGYLARVGQQLPVTMSSIFSLIALLMVFFTPLYTMRLLSEERRAGTLEILLTSPVRDWEVVLGKWLGGFLFYLATIAFTLVYVVLISVYAPTHFSTTLLGLHLDLPSVDYGGIVAGYVGVALVGAAWVALGVLASSLTSNQIIAAVLGVGILLTFQYLFGQLANFLLPPYSEFFGYLDANTHAQSFDVGRLVLRDVVFFLTLTAAALFVTARVVESRKWR
jgi:ABC-2 type transport system permease protein